MSKNAFRCVMGVHPKNISQDASLLTHLPKALSNLPTLLLRVRSLRSTPSRAQEDVPRELRIQILHPNDIIFNVQMNPALAPISGKHLGDQCRET